MEKSELLTMERAELRAVHAILSLRTPTRASIARAIGLSMVKVSELLAALQARSVIKIVGKAKTSGGRPAFIYEVNPDLAFTIGVSVWPDRLIITVADAAAAVVHDKNVPLELASDPSTHRDYLVERISTEVRDIVERTCAGKFIGAVGIALPGMVDSDRGVWFTGLQITGIFHVPLAELLERRLSLPVFIEDVARTLAFLELHRLGGRGLRHFVLLYLGHGMGTGVVINRRLYKGFHGLAGEVGHVEHAENNYRCSCNNVGCFETILSVVGMRRLFADRLNEGVRSMLRVAGELTPTIDEIHEAARAEDRFALMTLAEIGRFLGDSCAMLVKLFNPQRIYVTGPLSVFRSYFRQPVDEVIARRVLPEMLENFRTRFIDYRPRSEAHGAALLALDRLCRSRIKRAP